MLVLKTTSASKKYLDLTDDEYEKLSAVVALFTKETLLHHCRILEETFISLQRAVTTKRLVFEMALVKMCDPSLDQKMDSLISRISKLENAVALGTVIPSEQSVKKEIKQEPLKSVKEEKIVKDEPVKTLSEDSKSILKALRGWTEIVEKAAAGENSVLGFLNTSKAFVDGDGKIYIRFPNDFAMKMALANSKIKSNLIATLSVFLKRPISDNEIQYGAFEGNEKEIEELDELNI